MARVLLAAIAVAAFSAPPSPRQEKAQTAITEVVLRAHVRFLASDLMEGRGPGTRGDALARAYLAAELEALGLEPAAPGGGYFQPVPLVGITTDSPEAVTFAAGETRLRLRLGEDIVVRSGLQAPEALVDGAEVVFVGYGITAPEYRWDDFKDSEVRGKVLLVMNNDPEDDPALFEGKRRTYYGRWTYKYEEAARRGAAGMIVIHTAPSAAYPWSVVRTSFGGTAYELPDEGEPRLQVKAWATDDASHRIAALGGRDLDALRAAAQRRDFRPVPLGVRVSFRLPTRLDRTESANVMARLPGRDRLLAREGVLFTAHHDHFGIQEGATPGKDAIYNGALDNASGCAAVLGIARAFAALPERPRRSIFFAFVAAEEHDLRGSTWLARHPPLPAGRIAANLNFDSVRFFGRTRDVVLGALGKSTLDDAVVAAARSQGRVVKGDPFPERGSFYRSDHFSLARAGVPATSISSGIDVVGKPEGWGRARVDEWIAKHYHQPSDELGEDWDFSGMVEDARLGFLAGLRIAEAQEMPRWKPGDEFEAARRRALDSLQ
jgi:Zn-dependent M28 family amino/carboxypeptidase